jgi:malonyl-CoA/methylmalonyl-CoA synthetase
VTLPVEEALYFTNASRQVLMLHSSATKKLAASLEKLMQERFETPFSVMEIGPHLSKLSLEAKDIIISSDRFLDDNAAGLIIFTSGTTG